MKKSSKVFCLLFAVLMLFTLSVTAFAGNETNDGNIKIEVATDKGSYGATGVAEITATITNVSGEDINNVTAQAIFDDLAPAGKRKSETSKSVDVLKSGESFSFTYKATLNKNEHDLNFFQKIILWFVRLFNGGYNANNNHIDVVAECVTEIEFGKFTAENVIQVGYEEKSYNKNREEELDKIKQLNNGTLPEIEYSDYKNIDWIYGNYYNGTINNKSDAIDSLSSIKSLMNIENSNHNFECRYYNTHSNTDFYRLQQYYKNYMVYGAEWIICVNNNTGEILSGNGTIIPEEFFDFTCNISADDAKNIAKKYFGDNAKINETCNLIFKRVNEKDFKYYLTYVITINGKKTPETYYVSAKNGEIIYIDTYISTDRVSANGLDNNDKKRYFYCEKIQDNLYYLTDTKKNISIYDAGNKDVSWDLNTTNNTLNVYWNNVWYEFDSWFTKAEVVQNSKNEWNNKKAVTLMSNLSDVYDYYYENIGITGYNNNSGEVFAIINDNFNADRTNAYSVAAPNLNTTIISFGVDNNINLDTVAHEYTHSVMNSIVYLDNGESGALKEAYADILGEIIENDDSWTHGERVISNPTINKYPTYYKGENWGNTSSTYDKGYVHKNSTVISHAAYLMNINGIDKHTLANIWYKSISYLEHNSDFNDCRKAVVKAAEAYNCNQEIINIIKYCFYSVGITDNEVTGVIKDKENNKPITNAKITCEELGISCVTDNNGRFCLKVDDLSKQHTFNISQENYNSVKVTIAINSYSLLEEIKLIPKSATLTGTVTDSETGEPISGVTVEIIDNDDVDINDSSTYVPMMTVTTNENGKYEIKLPYGSYSLAFKHEDYGYYGTSLTVAYESYIKDITMSPKLCSVILYGTVKDSLTDNGISGVTVNIVNKITNNIVKTIITNQDGSLQTKNQYGTYDGFALPYGQYEIVFEHPNYETYIKELHINFTMKPIFGDILLTPKGEKTVTASGNCGADGDNVTWTLYEDGELVISGSGEMKDYTIPVPETTNSAPWSYTITKVKIEDGVTSVGNYAFRERKNLASIELPNTVISIGYDAFSGCSSLTSIEIPESVIRIRKGAFNYCDSLENIIVDENNQNYSSENGVLFNKEKNNLVQYPAGNKRTNYVIPTGITSIEARAFYDCENLISIKIPNSVTILCDSAFEFCKNLRTIELPNSITFIGVKTFRYCTNLTSIKIPESVTKIDLYAFSTCISLTDVYYTGTEEQWDKITIEDDNDYLLNATIHYNS